MRLSRLEGTDLPTEGRYFGDITITEMFLRASVEMVQSAWNSVAPDAPDPGMRQTTPVPATRVTYPQLTLTPCDTLFPMQMGLVARWTVGSQ